MGRNRGFNKICSIYTIKPKVLPLQPAAQTFWHLPSSARFAPACRRQLFLSVWLWQLSQDGQGLHRQAGSGSSARVRAVSGSVCLRSRSHRMRSCRRRLGRDLRAHQASSHHRGSSAALIRLQTRRAATLLSFFYVNSKYRKGRYKHESFQQLSFMDGQAQPCGGSGDV